MGIFGPFKCARCGRKFYGLNWKIKKGGDICSKCYDSLSKDMPYKKWHSMTKAELDEYYAEKKRLDEQPLCSCCGKEFDKSEPYTFILKDNSKICAECAGSVRIVKPVWCTQEYDTDDESYKDVFDDPLKEMTLQELEEAKKEAEAERERRTAEYGEHKAVFIVDDVTRYFKEARAHQLWGRVLLGRIDKGDMLCVKRREGNYHVEVTWIDPLEYNKKSEYLSEGHPGALMLLGDVSFIYPGDIITVEEKGR